MNVNTRMNVLDDLHKVTRWIMDIGRGGVCVRFLNQFCNEFGVF